MFASSFTGSGLSDNVNDTLALVFTVSVSVAELLPAVGSVTSVADNDAVFAIVPVALEAVVAVAVNVADAPPARSTSAAMLPVPLVPDTHAAAGARVQLTDAMPDGKLSTTLMP